MVDSNNKDDLRKFPEDDLYKFPNATRDCWLCSNCRKQVKAFVVENITSSEESSQAQTNTQVSSASDCETIDVLLKVSPVKRKRYFYSFVSNKIMMYNLTLLSFCFI